MVFKTFKTTYKNHSYKKCHVTVY